MQLLPNLQDIVNNIQIESDKLYISHCDYLPVETSATTIAHLQKMSQEIQEEYLKSELSKLIHGIYFEGARVKEAAKKNINNYEILKIISSLEIDWEFYEELDKNNKGKGWFHPDYRIVKEESDGTVAADFDKMIIHFQRERHLPLSQRSATVNDEVSAWLPNSVIDSLMYRANGDTIGEFPSAKVPQPQLYVYLNFTPDAAVSIMNFLTTELNAVKVPFIFEVLHNPLNYRYYTSGIIRFIYYDYEELVLPILKRIYGKNKSQFQSQVPLFTKEIAPGIGLGEHPRPQLQFNNNNDRFGMNRCKIVANALLEAHQIGDESPETRIKYIIQHFDRLRLDLERPYLNPNSEDIYTPLE